jgi:lipopolysaccharide biosynthesis glycosyltransferase
MRYFIPNHRWFANVERVLYLDADALAQKDLTELYEVELNNAALGVVKDFGKFRHHLKAGGTAATFKHFNSGVLVMDLPKLRELKFQENCIMETEISARAHEFSSDQEVMNSFMQSHVQYLDPKFNLAPHFIWHSQEWFKSDMFSNINEWNKIYNTHYKSTDELLSSSLIWHFNGDKKANRGSKPIRETMERAELKLAEFEFWALGREIGEHLATWRTI